MEKRERKWHQVCSSTTTYLPPGNLQISINAPPFPVVLLAIVLFESDAFLTEEELGLEVDRAAAAAGAAAVEEAAAAAAAFKSLQERQPDINVPTIPRGTTLRVDVHVNDSHRELPKILRK